MRKNSTADKRVNAAFNKACNGIPVSILDIPRVMNVGRAAILKGADDAELMATLRAFMETIRV